MEENQSISACKIWRLHLDLVLQSPHALSASTAAGPSLLSVISVDIDTFPLNIIPTELQESTVLKSQYFFLPILRQLDGRTFAHFCDYSAVVPRSFKPCKHTVNSIASNDSPHGRV